MNISFTQNEIQRLEAMEIYQLLETELAPDFNDIMDLAAIICDVPIALINMINNRRQLVKAKVHEDMKEIPSDLAFCSYTILKPEGLIIPNILEDKRFISHPLVIQEPYVRFYAGVPLITSTGNALGSISVMDYVSRQITEKQKKALQILANKIMIKLELYGKLNKTIAKQEQIQIALEKAKNELELKVAERTAELVDVNRRLNLELEERKHIEKALRESQDRFSGILEIAKDAIISIDANQNISLFNQGAENIFGYTAQEIIGKRLDILLPVSSYEGHQQHVINFAKSVDKARQMGKRQEIFGRRKDGIDFPCEASISKLEISGETIFTAILRDISENKKAQAFLEQLSRQNQLILNSVGEGLCGLDLDGNITFINPAAANMLKYSVNELINQPINVILNPDKCLTEIPIYTSLKNGVIHQVMQEVFYCRDGTKLPVEYVSNPLREKDKIVGAVIAFKDITERQIIERIKDEFISVVSHELRTPLTSIHGSLRLLASGLLSQQPERSQRLLKIAVDSTDRLVRLLNDILDVERIDSGKITMAKQICNTSFLINQAIESMQGMVEKGGLNLAISSVPIELFVDPDRIIQILTNLLSNAIKFSHPNKNILLKTELQENQILFQVKDEGRGIPADKLEKIFERFQQVDISDSRNHDGTGLGLAICRSIVQQHNGKIWVESILGEGSTFYFTLPFSNHLPAV